MRHSYHLLWDKFQNTFPTFIVMIKQMLKEYLIGYLRRTVTYKISYGGPDNNLELSGVFMLVE